MNRRLAPLFLVVALFAAACGGSDEAAVPGGADSAASAPTSTTGTGAADASTSTTATSQPGPSATEVALRELEGCTVSEKVDVGSQSEAAACVEAQLVSLGFLEDAVVPDTTFDETAEAALMSYQAENGLVADGIVGKLTATALGVWEEPPIPTPDPATCADAGHSAVVDRVYQRAWLCADGAITHEMPMTSALTQPDPGVYEVYAKDMDAWSDYSGAPSTMTHFVAFTRGKYQGARIAFHSIPKYEDGSFIQPLDTVGSAEWHGDSAGCIRVLPDDAVRVWDWLGVGDTVTVVS